jgi:hypothetical protein
VTEGERRPGGPTPIGRLLDEVGGTDTDIAKRASQWVEGGAVQRQTVTSHHTRPIRRLPTPELIRAIARAIGADLDAVTTAYIRSQEEYVRGVLGLGPSYQPPPGSLAHAYASRIDALPDAADRMYVLRAVRALVESVDREAEMTDAKPGTASEQAIRLAQRILDEIRDGGTEEDAQAALDELRRRKKKKQDDVS